MNRDHSTGCLGEQNHQMGYIWCRVSIKKSYIVCFASMCAGLVLVFTKSLQDDCDCLAHIPVLFSLSSKCPLYRTGAAPHGPNIEGNHGVGQ